MMKFNLLKWSCYLPQLPQIVAADGGELIQNCHTGKPELTNIPAMVKRRLPLVAKAMAQLDNELCAHELPSVFASKNAELSRTLKLIRQFDQDLSPAMFSMSVNNAIPGLLSVINKNKLPYTVIDSMSGILAMAFLEASTMLNDYPEVKVMLFEEETAQEFKHLMPHQPCWAFSFILTRGDALSVAPVKADFNQLQAPNNINFIEEWIRFFNREKQQMTEDYPRQQWQWKWH